MSAWQRVANWEGESEFDLSLKPLNGFPARCGWVRAIFAWAA
jgi:hypothetical protein